MGVPGLLFVNSKITSPDLSPEAFKRWYEDVHIPDIFKTSVMISLPRQPPGRADSFLAGNQDRVSIQILGSRC
jgi:hypothetical protein